MTPPASAAPPSPGNRRRRWLPESPPHAAGSSSSGRSFHDNQDRRSACPGPRLIKPLPPSPLSRKMPATLTSSQRGAGCRRPEQRGLDVGDAMREPAVTLAAIAAHDRRASPFSEARRIKSDLYLCSGTTCQRAAPTRCRRQLGAGGVPRLRSTAGGIGIPVTSPRDAV